jgi:4-hydroxy-3-polyprenylbenzoate decarboxylase
VLRLVVGITGASGVILGVRFLEALNGLGLESELVLSKWAERTLRIETDYAVEDVRKLATAVHSPDNLAAPISSGSYPTLGMVVVPCSMTSLAAIAHGTSTNLIHRAADVTMKEQRKLVLVPRESPLSPIHLRNMLALAEIGVAIVPPAPAFYNRPETIDDLTNHWVARILDQFGLENELTKRWGMAARKTKDYQSS